MQHAVSWFKSYFPGVSVILRFEGTIELVCDCIRILCISKFNYEEIGMYGISVGGILKCHLYTGTEILRKLEQIVINHCPDIKFILIGKDIATVKITDSWTIDNATMSIMVHGQSWYNLLGYHQENYLVEKSMWEIDISLRLRDYVAKHIQLYIKYIIRCLEENITIKLRSSSHWLFTQIENFVLDGKDVPAIDLFTHKTIPNLNDTLIRTIMNHIDHIILEWQYNNLVNLAIDPIGNIGKIIREQYRHHEAPYLSNLIVCYHSYPVLYTRESLIKYVNK